jgi:hypothetical protein
MLPGAGCLYPVLDLFKGVEQTGASVPTTDPKGKVMVFPEQLHMFPATGSHDVINPSRRTLGDILGQQGDPDVALSGNGACIGGDMAGQQSH